jgi:preprotein translocase subunit SecG
VSITDIIWVTLVLILITIILITDPKTSSIDVNNNILTNSLNSQRFVRNVTWTLVVTFYFLTLSLSIFDKLG